MKKGTHLIYFAIKVCEKDKNEILGHLPMEIPRVTKFLLDRGANVSSKLTSTHYGRSPLVQRGIEIPCVVTVSMPDTVINQLLMERCKQLVETLNTEPKKEEILGTFLQLENTGEQDLAPVAPKQKKKPKCPLESDKDQKIFKVILQRHPVKQLKNLKPRNRRAQMSSLLIEIWTLVFYLCFLNFFFSKESIIMNIERNLCPTN